MPGSRAMLSHRSPDEPPAAAFVPYDEPKSRLQSRGASGNITSKPPSNYEVLSLMDMDAYDSKIDLTARYQPGK